MNLGNPPVFGAFSRTLDPAFAGSNPAAPANSLNIIDFPSGPGSSGRTRLAPQAVLRPAHSRSPPWSGEKRTGITRRSVVLPSPILGDHRQILRAVGRPEREHQAPAGLELAQQRHRDMVDRFLDDHRIVRRLLAPAVVAVAGPGVDVVVLHVLEQCGPPPRPAARPPRRCRRRQRGARARRPDSRCRCRSRTRRRPARWPRDGS